MYNARFEVWYLSKNKFEVWACASQMGPIDLKLRVLRSCWCTYWTSTESWSDELLNIQLVL